MRNIWNKFAETKVSRNALLNAARAHEQAVQAELLGIR